MSPIANYTSITTRSRFIRFVDSVQYIFERAIYTARFTTDPSQNFISRSRVGRPLGVVEPKRRQKERKRERKREYVRLASA